MASQTNQSSQQAASEKFFRHFQQEVTDLQTAIARLAGHGTSGGERDDAIDHILSGIARLSHEVTDAGAAFLPARDQRTYADAVGALTTKLQEARAGFAPRPKFAFKKGLTFSARKNASAISLGDAVELKREERKGVTAGWRDEDGSSGVETGGSGSGSPVTGTVAEAEARKGEAGASSLSSSQNAAAAGQQQQSNPAPQTSASPTAIRLSHHTNAHIILPPSAAPSLSSSSSSTASGTITNITRSIIDLTSRPSSTTTSSSPSNPSDPQHASLSGLTLKHIHSSLILCGTVAGAAHLTDISDSVIVVRTRQFRMHESRNVRVYLDVRSRPIIEDCEGIGFAPAPVATVPVREAAVGGVEGGKPKEEGDEAAAALWAQVDDFKWLKAEPSPNWRVLPLAERVEESVWREIVPGGKGLGVEEILNAVGVPV